MKAFFTKSVLSNRMSSKRSWADLEEDESSDIFSPEAKTEFLIRYHREHIEWGFIPADTPLILPLFDSKPTNKKESPPKHNQLSATARTFSKTNNTPSYKTITSATPKPSSNGRAWRK